MTSTTSTSDAVCSYATCSSCERYCYTGESVTSDWECADCDADYEFCDECNETFHQDDFCEHLLFIFAGCVDDRDAPNIAPYKMCVKCSERKSCGAYHENEWFCENCGEEDQEWCGETNPYECRGCGNATDIIGDKCADCR
jgi:hypothetical protein